MTAPHLKQKTWARGLAILTSATCALAVLPALLPAGFAMYKLEDPGTGLLHDIYVWFTMAVLMLMPVIALTGVFWPWRAYRRGQYSKAVAMCVIILALLAYWAYWAYGIYFS